MIPAAVLTGIGSPSPTNIANLGHLGDQAGEQVDNITKPHLTGGQPSNTTVSQSGALVGGQQSNLNVTNIGAQVGEQLTNMNGPVEPGRPPTPSRDTNASTGDRLKQLPTTADQLLQAQNSLDFLMGDDELKGVQDTPQG